MAYVEVEPDDANIVLYKTSAAKPYRMRFNSATWKMIGRPWSIDVFYDSDLNRLCIRNGHSFAVTCENDELPFVAYIRPVYTAAGLALVNNTEYAPQAFAWGEQEQPIPDLIRAVWIQL